MAALTFPLSSSLSRSLALQRHGQAFHPRRLFIGSTVGAIYDYDDYAYLYQKSDGSTPVTALEQPVGFMRDKRYGTALGDDVKSSGAARLIGVATAATFNTSTGAGTAVRVDGSNVSGVRFSGLTRNSFYALTVSNTGSASLTIRTGGINETGVVAVAAGSSGTYFALSNATGDISISPTSNGTTIGFTVSAVRLIPGLHAYQTTDAARPVISARYNLLLNTVFAGAVAGTPGTAPTGWTANNTGGTLAVSGSSLTFSATAARQTIFQSYTAPVGSHTARVKVDAVTGSQQVQQVIAKSGTSTSTNQYKINGSNVAATAPVAAGDVVSLEVNVTVAGTLVTSIGLGTSANATGSVTLSEPDLRLTADANARLPPYQRINNANDYDSAGFPRFLRIDATDDFLQTASVDPGTDKVFVCAGVTKVADVIGTLIESSIGSGSTNGTFALFVPFDANGNAMFRSRGTSAADNTGLAVLGPITRVISGIGDISGDSSRLRANGTEAPAVTTDQGTGNYTAQPLYIGARAGTSLRLNNGRIYPMVICFKAVTAGEIAATEAWVNARTRAY